MTVNQWSDRNSALNALGLAIHQGARGLIRDLALDLADDRCAVVRFVSHSYYGVQLAIHATQQFGAAHPVLLETRLLVQVAGSTLELVVSHRPFDGVMVSPSTHNTERRLQLTVPAIA